MEARPTGGHNEERMTKRQRDVRGVGRGRWGRVGWNRYSPWVSGTALAGRQVRIAGVDETRVAETKARRVGLRGSKRGWIARPTKRQTRSLKRSPHVTSKSQRAYGLETWTVVGTVVDRSAVEVGAVLSQVYKGGAKGPRVRWGRGEGRVEPRVDEPTAGWLVHEYVGLVDHRSPGLQRSWECTLGSLAECKDPTPPHRLAPWWGRWGARDERPNLNGVGIRVRKK